MRALGRSLLLVLGFGVAGPAGCRRDIRSAPASAPGRLLQATMPDFRRPTFGGAPLDTAGLRGKIVVVEFFAEYCAPCKRTLPQVERLHRRLGEDVVFVGVAEDPYPSDSAAFVEAMALSFAVVHDPGGAIAGRFRVTEIPATFVIDRQGVVRWIAGAGMPDDALERAIAAVR